VTALDLSYAPAIPGLTFRSLDPQPDAVAMTTLMNEAAVADGVPERHNAERMALWLEHPSEGFDPAHDFVIAEVDGTMVAFGQGGYEVDNDGGYNCQTYGEVLPAWRGRGLGTALLRWVEERQRAVAAGHPAGAVQRLEGWCYDAQTSRRALFEENGYGIVRYWFEMHRPTLDNLSEVKVPDGVELRAGTPEDVRRVWELEVAAFRDHWGSIEDDEASFVRRRDNPLNDYSLWVLAWHDDELVGEVINRIDPEENAELGWKRGWLGSVAVRRDWRRRGVAHAMVAQSLRVLRDAGMSSAGLGVDAENPNGALGLYESNGFEVAVRGSVYRKPL
jgi:mycothiol synthase